MSDDFEPETVPPTQPPRPAASLNLTKKEYLMELARRLDIHARENCCGTQATREVGIAAMLLRTMAKDMDE